MAINIAYATGTHAIDTTEWSLSTDTSFSADAQTDDGVYQLVLDLSDMVLSDVLQIRLYECARSGDAQRCVKEWILSNAQSCPNWMSDAYTLGNGWDFTLDALAGTITVLWSIRRVS